MKSQIRAAGLCLGLALGAGAASAGELVRVATDKSVPEAADALEAAVSKAGATLFARVDHAAGAQKAGLSLSPSQLLIFGNPKLGSPAMQADARAGLFLPLKVLIYQDAEGKTLLSYQDPADMLGALDIDPKAEVITKMQGALSKLTSAAAN